MIDNNWIEALVTCACILGGLILLGLLGFAVWSIFMFKPAPQKYEPRVQVRKEYQDDKNT